MKVIETNLAGCLIIEPEVHRDERGFFTESFNLKRYREFANILDSFVQDNHSRSSYGVLRGLHFQKSRPQGKLVRASRGEVFDVAVDLRSSSETFGQWTSVILSEAKQNQLWIPPGFAHGFLVLSQSADFQYKCTSYYDPSDEGSILWSDTDLNISWPIEEPILSAKDSDALAFGKQDFSYST